MTYGIIHHGEVIRTASFGYRNIENKLPVNAETIFPIASLTKAPVAAGIGILVEEGKLNFTTPVSEVLPEFRTQSDLLHHDATISDFMSMRTGMQSTNNWLQSQNDIMFPELDTMKILNSFSLIRPFRADWNYNNWGFELAGQVISNKAGGDS